MYKTTTATYMSKKSKSISFLEHRKYVLIVVMILLDQF
jgi:hypothetical protein